MIGTVIASIVMMKTRQTTVEVTAMTEEAKAEVAAVATKAEVATPT